MSGLGIFREELPGEKKSIMTLIMTGYFVAVSCMGYLAFYLYIQLTQMDRITEAMNFETLTPEQFALLKTRLLRASEQIRNEMTGLAIIGGIVCVAGGVYTYNLVIRPLRQLIAYAAGERQNGLPDIKTNNEIKQLAAAVDAMTAQRGGSPAGR